jgi:hypothetical protein
MEYHSNAMAKRGFVTLCSGNIISESDMSMLESSMLELMLEAKLEDILKMVEERVQVVEERVQVVDGEHRLLMASIDCWMASTGC